MKQEGNTFLEVTTAQLDRLKELARKEEVSVSGMLEVLIFSGENELRRGNGAALMSALEACWAAAEKNGTANMSMEEIDSEIAAYRAERRLTEAA